MNTTHYRCDEVPLGRDLAAVTFDVTFAAYPPEPRTRDYPGCPASCEIEIGQAVEIETATDTRPPLACELAPLAEWFDRQLATDDAFRESIERHCLEVANERAAERHYA